MIGLAAVDTLGKAGSLTFILKGLALGDWCKHEVGADGRHCGHWGCVHNNTALSNTIWSLKWV